MCSIPERQRNYCWLSHNKSLTLPHHVSISRFPALYTGVEKGAVELHAHTDTHTHTCVLVASRKCLACNPKAVFGVLFPLLHSTGCKTVMLQNSVLQIRSKLGLCTARITFISPVPWGGRVTFVSQCASVHPPPAPSPRGSCGTWLLPSSSRCSRTDRSSGDGSRSCNLICA